MGKIQVEESEVENWKSKNMKGKLGGARKCVFAVDEEQIWAMLTLQ